VSIVFASVLQQNCR